MNREKLVYSAGKLYEEKQGDIFNQVSNIAYLASGMTMRNDKRQVFFEVVEELKYQPYSGQYFLEKVAKWYQKWSISDEELISRMEIMIEAEQDEYLQLVYFLYYVAMSHFLYSNVYKSVIERICCIFPKDIAGEIEKQMELSYSVQERKRQKRREVNLQKLHYRWSDERINQMESFLAEMQEEDLIEELKQLQVYELISFMLICSQKTKEKIYENLNVDMKQKIDEFQGESYALRRENIKTTVNNLWERWGHKYG